MVSRSALCCRRWRLQWLEYLQLMAWIQCQETFDDNDPLECLDEDWQGTGMCRYCWDIDEHSKALELLGS